MKPDNGGRALNIVITKKWSIIISFTDIYFTGAAVQASLMSTIVSISEIRNLQSFRQMALFHITHQSYQIIAALVEGLFFKP